MPVLQPFNIQKWVDENKHLLKPPVNNYQFYRANDDFIVMVVGGPNSRKDFHYNKGEEFFYQLEGDILVKIFEDGEIKDIHIKEGEIFLLPKEMPHSPRRGPNTIGLVVERYRHPHEKDGFMWFCEHCSQKLYEEHFSLEDIVTQLPKVMEKYYNSVELRTCKKCGTIMQPPPKL